MGSQNGGTEKREGRDVEEVLATTFFPTTMEPKMKSFSGASGMMSEDDPAPALLVRLDPTSAYSVLRTAPPFGARERHYPFG